MIIMHCMAVTGTVLSSAGHSVCTGQGNGQTAWYNKYIWAQQVVME